MSKRRNPPIPPDEPLTPQEMGRRGGRSRATKLSPEKLTAIGKRGGKASGAARRKKAGLPPVEEPNVD